MRQSLVKRAGLIAVGCLLSCLSYPGYGQEAPASPAETLLQQAVEYVNSGELQLAVQACEQVIASYPECEYDARLMLAQVYRAQGRQQEAIQQATLALAKVVSLYPDDSQRITAAQEALARLRTAQESFTQQLAQYQRIIEQQPGSAQALDAQYRVGCVYAMYFKYDQAIEQLTNLIKEHPKSTPAAKAFNLLQVVFVQTDRQQEALEVIPSLVETYCSDAPQMLLKLCQFYKTAGKLDDAQAAAERVVADYPDSDPVAGALQHLIAIYDGREGPGAAGEKLRALAAKYPDTKVATATGEVIDQAAAFYYAKGLGLGNQNQYQQAIAQFDQALALRPPGEIGAQAAFQRAICYQTMGQQQAALAAFGRVVSDYPESYLSVRAAGRIEKITVE